ncbi:MAG: hypothetical protein IJX17_03130 [Clostridia bacterium]|nr:hypothetical protein [Clostridia bacterium]
MLPKMKRKYFVNNAEYYGIDSTAEFLSLIGKYDKSTAVVKALHQVAKTVKNEQDLKIIEEVIKNHIVYNNNAGKYRENGKDYIIHNIIPYKMPKDLEKTILEVASKTQSKPVNDYTNEQSLLSSLSI